MRENWTYKKMSEVFDLQMGKTPDRKTPSYFGGNNVWVSIRDLVGKEIGESNEHITDTAVTTTNIRKVKKGTVIMSFKLTVGKCAITTKDLYTNEAIMAFNLKEGYDICPDYLYYYLSNYNWRGANKAVMGITLNKATISQQKVGYPSLSEQHAIVSELDKINELINLKKAQLSDLDALAQSIFYDMFGEPIENEKGWEYLKLQTLIDNNIIIYHLDGNHGGDYPRSEEFVDRGVPYIGANCLNDGSVDFSLAKYLPKEKADKLRKGLAKNGDVLFAHNATVGPVAFLNTKEPLVILSTSLTAFRCNLEKMHPLFLKSYMQSTWFESQYKSAMKQTTRNQIPITKQKNMFFICPPLSLQQDFAKRIELIEQQKAQISSTIKDLETLLASRMQYWFD